jgi:uncharacterized protein (DUF58 family)
MAVSGWLGRNNLARLEVDVRLPEEIYDGVETLITVRLRNRQRWLPVCLVNLEFEGTQARFPLVVRRGREGRSLAVTFCGRGVRRLPAIRVSSTFPINFFVRTLIVPVEGEVLVFPRPRPVSLSTASAAGAAQGDRATDRGYEGDLTRIDDYRGGEPLKMIHWKISARQDQLKVKELSSLAAPPLLIDPHKLPGRTLEERLGGACWLVKELCRRNRSVGLQLDGVRIPPACGRHQQLRLLGALARYGTDPHTA